MMQKSEEFIHTENYIWNKKDLIGKGGVFTEIHIGRHKKNGELVAVKRLNNPNYSDLDTLRSQINHCNIVRVLGMETQLNAKNNTFLVTEYCSRGSLHDIISKRPENKFGLSDEEFLKLLKCLNNGLKELSKLNKIHRDLKPGNILLYRCCNGDTIYKLSDLGHSTGHSTHGNYQISKWGDYEFAAPIDKSSNNCVCLFSLGATLYFAATGKLIISLPTNSKYAKKSLCDILSKKPSDGLSATQSSEGSVTWSNHLPQQCALSIELNALVSEILRKLLETNKDKKWTFKDFSQNAEQILNLHHIKLFQPLTTELRSVYLQNSDLQTIHDKIKEIWQIEKSALLFQQGILLESRLLSSEPVILCPKKFKPDLKTNSSFCKPDLPGDFIIIPIEQPNLREYTFAVKYVSDLSEAATALVLQTSLLQKRIQLLEKFGHELLYHLKDKSETMKTDITQFNDVFHLVCRICKKVVDLAATYVDSAGNYNSSLPTPSLMDENAIIDKSMHTCEEMHTSAANTYDNFVKNTFLNAWKPRDISHDKDTDSQFLINCLSDLNRSIMEASTVDDILLLDIARVSNYYRQACDTFSRRRRHLQQLNESFINLITDLKSTQATLIKQTDNLDSLRKKMKSFLSRYLDDLSNILQSPDTSSMTSISSLRQDSMPNSELARDIDKLSNTIQLVEDMCTLNLLPTLQSVKDKLNRSTP